MDPMRICLMVEGQEDVTWDAVAGAGRRLRGGRARRPVPVRPLPLGPGPARPGRARRVGDARRPGRRHRPDPAGHAGLAGHVPAPVGAGQDGGHRRPRLRWPGRAGHRRRVAEAEHEAYGFPLPAAARPAWRCWRSRSRSSTARGQTGPFDFAGRHYRLRGPRRPAQARAAAPPEPHRRAAAAGARSIAIAARWADEYNTVFASPEVCRERRARRGRGVASGRGATRPRVVVLGDDRLRRRRRPRRAPRRAEAVMDRHGDAGDGRRVARRARAASGSSARRRGRRPLRRLEDAGVQRVMLQHLAHDDVEPWSTCWARSPAGWRRSRAGPAP